MRFSLRLSMCVYVNIPKRPNLIPAFTRLSSNFCGQLAAEGHVPQLWVSEPPAARTGRYRSGPTLSATPSNAPSQQPTRQHRRGICIFLQTFRFLPAIPFSGPSSAIPFPSPHRTMKGSVERGQVETNQGQRTAGKKRAWLGGQLNSPVSASLSRIILPTEHASQVSSR